MPAARASRRSRSRAPRETGDARGADGGDTVREAVAALFTRAGPGGAAGPRPRRPALGDVLDGRRACCTSPSRTTGSGAAAVPRPDRHARRARRGRTGGSGCRRPSCCRCRRSRPSATERLLRAYLGSGEVDASVREALLGPGPGQPVLPRRAAAAAVRPRRAAPRGGPLGAVTASCPRTCCPPGCRPCSPPASTTCPGAAKGVLRDASVLGSARDRARPGGGRPGVRATATRRSSQTRSPPSSAGGCSSPRPRTAATCSRTRWSATSPTPGWRRPSGPAGTRPSPLGAGVATEPRAAGSPTYWSPPRASALSRLAAEMDLPADDPAWRGEDAALTGTCAARAPGLVPRRPRGGRPAAASSARAPQAPVRRTGGRRRGRPDPDRARAAPSPRMHRLPEAEAELAGSLDGGLGAGARRTCGPTRCWCSATSGTSAATSREPGRPSCRRWPRPRPSVPTGSVAEATAPARAARLLRGPAEGRRGPLRAGPRAGRADRRRARGRLGAAAAGLERHHPR